MKKLIIFLISVLVILGLATGVSAVTKTDLLTALDDALADGVVDSLEKTELLDLLDAYLAGPVDEEQKFPLPDLTIINVTVEPVSPNIELPTKGYNLVAKVIVKNIGEETAGLGQDAICTVIKKVNADGTVGAKISELCMGETIAPGKTFIFDFSLYPFKYDTAGTHKVYAYVDSTYSQLESNENNNGYYKTFQVYT